MISRHVNYMVMRLCGHVVICEISTLNILIICDWICENVPYDQNEHSSIQHFLESDVNFYEIFLFVVFDI